MVLCCAGNAIGDTFPHRAAITNWITAGGPRPAVAGRKTALGSALTRYVAAGEVVAVSTGDVEKIGWFVEAVPAHRGGTYHRAGLCGPGRLRAGTRPRRDPGLPVVLAPPSRYCPAAPGHPAGRRPGEKAAAPPNWPRTPSRGCACSAYRRRGTLPRPLPQRSPRCATPPCRARMWSLISAIQVMLPGLLLIAVVWHGVHLACEGRIGVGELAHGLQLRHDPHLSAQVLRGDRHGVLLLPALGQAGRTGARAATGHRHRWVACAPPRSRPGPVRPPTGLLAPAGWFTAVCAATPTRPGVGGTARWAPVGGGHVGPAGRGVPPDELPLESARTAVLVQDKDPVLLRTPRELLGRCRLRVVGAEDALAAAQCDDVLAAPHRDHSAPTTRWTPASPSGAALLSGGQRQRLALARSLDHRPGGTRPRRTYLRRGLAHRGTDRTGVRTLRAGRAPRWCSPRLRCCWTARTGSCSSTTARWRRSARTGTAAPPSPGTGGGDPRDRRGDPATHGATTRGDGRRRGPAGQDPGQGPGRRRPRRRRRTATDWKRSRRTA